MKYNIRRFLFDARYNFDMFRQGEFSFFEYIEQLMWFITNFNRNKSDSDFDEYYH